MPLARRFQEIPPSRWLSLVGVIIALWSNGAWAQSNSETERMAQAKKEGLVNLYTSWDVDRSAEMKRLFEKRYPGIQVNVYRATSGAISSKISLEAKAGRHEFDVATPGDLFWKGLYDQKIFAPYCSPERDAYPSDVKDDRCYWTMPHLNTHVIVFNTLLVAKNDVPKNNQDLLQPRWKDKLVMSSDDYRWFTYMMDKMGEAKGAEFMKRLAAQRPSLRAGHSIQLQLLAAGEFPVNVMGYGFQAEQMRAKGAPLDWTVDEPVTVTGAVISISNRPPHPEAAKLLVDFLLSQEAQKAMARLHSVPSRPDVLPDPPRLAKGLKLYPVKPELTELMNKRTEQFRAIFGLK
jgi:ABC-type Fe3+ transport system substrate-binding protein